MREKPVTISSSLSVRSEGLIELYCADAELNKELLYYARRELRGDDVMWDECQFTPDAVSLADGRELVRRTSNAERTVPNILNNEKVFTVFPRIRCVLSAVGMGWLTYLYQPLAEPNCGLNRDSRRCRRVLK